MYGVDLYLQKNRSLVENAKKAIEAAFPVTSVDGRTQVEASNIQIKWDGELPGLRVHQVARQNGASVTAPITGDIVLKRDGKKVQSLRNFKLGELPILTQLGTFMVNGGDYFTPNQLRLKPGAYTREMANGQLETFINLRGRPVRLWMEPDKGVLKLGYGSSNVDFVPIMQAIGVSDADLVQAFGGGKRGQELLANNVSRNPEPQVEKLLRAIMDRKQNRDLVRAGLVKVDSPVDRMSTQERIGALREWFSKQKVDPFVMRKTLGHPFETLTPDMLIGAAKKLLGVSRQEAKPDDRDSLEFKTLHGVDDMLPERIKRTARLLARKLLNRLNRQDSTIARGFGKNWLNTATMGYFGASHEVDGGLANTAEAANPLAILSEHSKATLMGEGGIGDERAVSNSARLFRPLSSGFVDPVHSPEGRSIGVTTHLAWNAVKTLTNNITTKMYKVGTDGKIEKMVDLSIEDASDAVVAYPETWDVQIGGKAKSATVRANVNGEIDTVPASKVQYVIPSGRAMLDHTSNAALFFHHTHANRGMMAGKHLTQALPLENRELPLSDIKDGEGKSVLEALARPFVIRSSVAGEVTKVSATEIVVKSADGQLHKHEIFDVYPMQAKVGIEHIAAVKVGDKVKKDQLLADTNYSKDGKLALGVNVRTAYTPWKNAGNFEDAIVVSESAAKTKFVSNHIHRLELDLTVKDLTVGKRIAQAQFPTLFTADAWKNLGDDGVVKEGAVVHPGDVIIAAVKKNVFDPHDRSAKNLGSIHKSLQKPFLSSSVAWDEDFPGTVYRVVRTPTKIEVHLKTQEGLRVGDKLSMSSAAKGTVAQVVPDDKMPLDAKGRPIEVIVNPHGVAGRINPSQTIEQAAGKLVRDHGVTYDHALFDGVDHPAELKKLLAKQGDTHTEKLFDPETGKHTEDPVAVGYNYMFKLDHPVRKKFSARERDGYTMDETPTAGKGRGGQSYDQLTTYALLGHNAHAILGESFGTRGVKNDDFWHAYQAGETPPPPKVPFVFEKFRSMLNAAGVDTKQHGNTLHYLPMTEKSVLQRSNGKLTKATTLRARGAKALDVVEEKEGLFDVDKTGGLGGDRWTHFELEERIPHPLYEKVIRDMTGLKTADYYGLLAHSAHIDPKTGKLVEPGEGTLTGEAAFKKLLSFDVDEKAKEIKAKLKTAVGSDANKLNRAHRYLMGLKETGLKPDEAYLTKVVPVLPPKYRPVIEMNGGALRVADSNLLYRDAMLATNQLASAKASGVPSEMLKDSRLNVYKSIGALVGVNNALTHRDDRDDARGIVDVIKGRSNKEGLFQRMLARRRNDYTGRSTIEPDASLGVDEIGIPDDMAWKIYKPTIVRRMVQGGWKPAEASEQVEKRTLAASQALEAEMAERPVLYNRAPSLHRWSMIAARPFRIPGKEIKISPAVIGPLGADYDGDTMSVTVPITESAKREAHGLLPSRNLKYDKDRSLAFGLEKDVITGLFVLTKGGIDTGKTFDSAEEAIKAYRDPKSSLRMDNMVQIKGMQGKQAIGWLLFQEVVPARFLAGVTAPVDGKKLEKILDGIATNSPADFNMVVRKIAQAGFSAAAAKGGITSSIDELAMDRGKVNRLIDQLDTEVKQIRTQGLPMREQNKKLKSAHDRYVGDINKEVSAHLDSVGHGYSAMMQARMSGKINPDQFRQMLASPLLMTDVNDNTVPAVITSNYGRGMTPSDYILTTPGARKGMVGKSLATAMPGALAKEVAGNLSPVRIFEKDCGTLIGIEMPLEDSSLKNYDADLLDRHLLKDIPGTSYKRNDPVTTEMLSRLRDSGRKSIWVRSPMTCQAQKSPCQLCAGRDATGELHPIGANIGLNYGQSVSERSTQLTLRCSAGLVTLNGELLTFHEAAGRTGLLSRDPIRGVQSVRLASAVVNDAGGAVPVLSIERHRPHAPMLFLQLRSGASMVVQEDHPVVVKAGPIHVPKRALQPNTKFRLVGKDSYRHTDWEYQQDGSPAGLATKLAGAVAKGDAMWVDYRVPGEFDHEPAVSGYLIGTLLGDGGIHRSIARSTEYGVCVWSKSGAAGQDAIKIKQKQELKSRYGKVRETPTLLYASGSSALSDYREYIGGCEDSSEAPEPANRKYLRGDVSRYSRKWLRGLLAGLIDTDGYVSNDCGTTVLHVCSTSYQLICQLQVIAKALGFMFNISVEDRKNRPKQHRTAFIIHLRMPRPVKIPAVKLRGVHISCSPRVDDGAVYGWDVVTNVRVLYNWDAMVYDVKTASGTYMLGAVQNHNSFHSGGTLGSGDSLSQGFARLRELLSAPDIVRDQGTLSDVDGRVHNIRQAPQGGQYVTVLSTSGSPKEHYVASNRKVIVKAGDEVKIGEPLSDGSYRPQEIAQKKGLLQAQQYVVDEARKAYQHAGAVVRKPVLEVLAAGTMRFVRITDDADLDGIAIGDVMPEQQFEALKKKHPKMRAVPELPGLSSKPLLSGDLMERLNFQRLEDAVREVPAMGGKSDLTGSSGSPLAGFAYGANFRPGEAAFQLKTSEAPESHDYDEPEDF